MQRVKRTTAVSALPAAPAGGTPGYFANPNPGGGVAATVPGYEWFNSIQEELCAVIAAAGMALDVSDTAQLLAALRSAGVFQTQATNDSSTKAATTAFVQNLAAFRNFLSGLTLSTAGNSTTVSIAPGVAADSTNTRVMALAAAIAKTTSAWAVGTGNGGLDTGAIAINTWYHFYEIMRLDTGGVDVIFSTSAAAPALPANYTLFRRIGSAATEPATTNWKAFVQDGDLFQWKVPIGQTNTTNPGTSAISVVMSAPLGIITTAWLAAALYNVTTGNAVLLLSDLATADNVPDSVTNFSLVSGPNSLYAAESGDFFIRTNTSQQIRYRMSASGAGDIVRIASKGWIDTRGRFA